MGAQLAPIRHLRNLLTVLVEGMRAGQRGELRILIADGETELINLGVGHRSSSSIIFALTGGRDVQIEAKTVCMHEVAFDDAAGIIRVRITGFQTDADVKTYMADLTKTVSEVRGRGLPVLVLADTTGTAVRSPATSAHQKDANRLLYRPEDKVALVITSALLKMQVERDVGLTMQRSFADTPTAERWLIGN